MEHLYASEVKVQRLQLVVQSGRTAIHDWVDQTGVLASFRCRIDLNFVRPGKDAPPALNAGVATNRFGLLFCSASIPLQAGDRIVTLSGPVSGTFEIKAIPDTAQDFGSAHHIEVQIFETNQTLSGTSTFPSEDGPPEPTPLIEP